MAQLKARHQKLLEMKAALDRDVGHAEAKVFEGLRMEAPPVVAHALGEVLVQTVKDTYAARAEIRVLELELAAEKVKLARADDLPVTPEEVERSLARMPPLEHRADLDRREAELAKLLTVSGPDAPAVKSLKAEIDKLRADATKAEQERRAQSERQIRDLRSQAIRDAITTREDQRRVKEQLLEYLNETQQLLTRQLTSDRRASREPVRLTEELKLLREKSAQLTREILAVESEMAGVPPAGPGAPDDKLDRILRELAELRAEVRQLRQQKK
jgi:hypothetical protein